MISTNFHGRQKEDETNYKESNLNSELNKGRQRLMHKAATYLQLILEREHRDKWRKQQVAKMPARYTTQPN